MDVCERAYTKECAYARARTHARAHTRAPRVCLNVPLRICVCLHVLLTGR